MAALGAGGVSGECDGTGVRTAGALTAAPRSNGSFPSTDAGEDRAGFARLVRDFFVLVPRAAMRALYRSARIASNTDVGGPAWYKIACRA